MHRHIGDYNGESIATEIWKSLTKERRKNVPTLYFSSTFGKDQIGGRWVGIKFCNGTGLCFTAWRHLSLEPMLLFLVDVENTNCLL